MSLSSISPEKFTKFLFICLAILLSCQSCLRILQQVTESIVVLRSFRRRRFMTIYRNQAMNWTLDCLNFLFEINVIGSTTLYLARPQRILLALVGFVVACIGHQLFPCLRRQR